MKTDDSQTNKMECTGIRLKEGEGVKDRNVCVLL
jgi:hypothetical protein